MQNGKGVPETTDLDKLTTWCKEHSPKAWQDLLSSITGMQHGIGVPDQLTLEGLEKLYSTLKNPEVPVADLLDISFHERLVELRKMLKESGFQSPYAIDGVTPTGY